MLQIITTEKCVHDNWYNFGYQLRISVGVLNEIENTCSTSAQCTRRVILHWRSKNKKESWKVLATALVKVDLPDIAHKLKDRFDPKVSPKVNNLPKRNSEYCEFCDSFHRSIHDVPGSYFIYLSCNI